MRSGGQIVKILTRTIIFATLVGLALLANPAASALAKGPAIMMVYGPPLLKSVAISNGNDNAVFAFATADSTSVMHAKLKGRPYMKVAMFWGSQWNSYLKHHSSLSGLSAARANQFARLYPAYGSAPSFFVLDAIPGPYTSLVRRITPSGLRLLSRYGIPTRLRKGR